MLHAMLATRAFEGHVSVAQLHAAVLAAACDGWMQADGKNGGPLLVQRATAVKRQTGMLDAMPKDAKGSTFCGSCQHWMCTVGIDYRSIAQ